MKTTRQKKNEVSSTAKRSQPDRRSIERLIRDLISGAIDELGTTIVSAQRANQITISERDMSVILNFARSIGNSAAAAGAQRIAAQIVT